MDADPPAQGVNIAGRMTDDDEKDLQLVEYRRLISQSTDSEECITARLDVFEKRFFDAVDALRDKTIWFFGSASRLFTGVAESISTRVLTPDLMIRYIRRS